MADKPAATPSAAPETTTKGKQDTTTTSQQKKEPGEATAEPKFTVRADTQEEEDSYDLYRARNIEKPSGLIGTVAHMVKGALGAGVLSGHVSYMKAGIVVALVSHIILSIYITYCIYFYIGAFISEWIRFGVVCAVIVLGKNAQILYKRTKTPSMSYPDVGEAAVICTQNPKIVRYSKALRYFIDVIICIDLFGSCACYQLIIAKSLKQLVENQVNVAPQADAYAGIKVYVAIIMLPCVLICLLRHLQWLAPISFVANVFIALCICLTIYYAMHFNPSLSGLASSKDVKGFFQFLGMMIFSMSCSGVVLPVENNMRDPRKLSLAIILTYICIVTATISISFFGYVAFKEECHSPITVNFPMDIIPKILKVCIALMIYATHALNYWVPFQLVFHYLQKIHKKNLLCWEYFYRAFFVIIISTVAIVFPSIEALMGFLGTFCVANMALVWPHLIELLVVYTRPGYGPMKWRLWKSLFLIFVGIFIWAAGTYINAIALYSTARGKKVT